MENQTLNNQWTLFQKIAFRFCFLFFGLHIFPFPLDYIPKLSDVISTPYQQFLSILINWAGKTFFGLPEITLQFTGSGDKTWDWVFEFIVISLSVIGTIIWSVLDRKHNNYNVLNFWNNIWLRYYLGVIMLSYGFAKVFPSQFGNVTTYRLHQQLGDMSPMGLLWTFMAYSEKYQFFGGIMEVIPGVLLFFRNTRLLGTLIAIGVMANIFALNLCYDVPVKIYSFLLMLIAIYLAAPDFNRLLNFFILQKPTEITPQYQPSFFSKKNYKIGVIVLKTLIIAGFFYLIISPQLEFVKKKNESLSAFYGPYNVNKHIKNGSEVMPDDSLRWQHFFIDRRGSFDMIYASNELGHSERIFFEKNDSLNTIQFSTVKDTMKYVLSYQQPDTTHLFISGKFGKDSLHLELTKLRKRDFILVKREFHWVNETPFNR